MKTYVRKEYIYIYIYLYKLHIGVILWYVTRIILFE